MNLDIETVVSLYLKALESERDERLFQQWCVQLPLMGFSDSYMSYREYKDRMTGANIDIRPTSAILSEIDELEKEINNGT